MKNIYITVILTLVSSYSFAGSFLDSAANAARNVVDSTVGAVRRATNTDYVTYEHSDRPTVVEHTEETKDVRVDKDHPHLRRVTKTYKQIKTVE